MFRSPTGRTPLPAPRPLPLSFPPLSRFTNCALPPFSSSSSSLSSYFTLREGIFNGNSSSSSLSSSKAVLGNILPNNPPPLFPEDAFSFLSEFPLLFLPRGCSSSSSLAWLFFMVNMVFPWISFPCLLSFLSLRIFVFEKWLSSSFSLLKYLSSSSSF